MRIFNLLFSFKGKINRLQYLAGLLALIVLGAVAFLIIQAGNPMPTHAVQSGIAVSQQIDMNATQFSNMSALKATISSVVFLILAVFMLIGILAITIKRLRDIGWNVWLAVLLFVPVITHILTLLCLFVPTKQLRGGF